MPGGKGSSRSFGAGKGCDVSVLPDFVPAWNPHGPHKESLSDILSGGDCHSTLPLSWVVLAPIVPELVSGGCHNTLQARQLTTTKVYSLSVLEASSPQWRCGRHWSSQSSGQDPRCLLQLLVAPRCVTPVSLPPSSRGFVPVSESSSVHSSSRKDPSHGA